MRINLVLTGRAYQQGQQLPEQLELPDESRMSDALAAITAALPEGESLPGSCLLALAGTHIGTVDQHPDPVLGDGQELLLIAPVAGG